MLEKFDTVMGLKIDKQDKKEQEIPEEIKELMEKRQKARQEKNWAEADKIRDEILAKGYTVQDTK